MTIPTFFCLRFGRDLSQQAADMDDQIHGFPAELRPHVRELIEDMHDMAKALLGDQAKDYYDETEESCLTA